jgi:hypothetical protein
VFADLDGADTYKVSGPPGAATDQAVGVFFDGGGGDEYPTLPGVANGATRRDGGGLFRDR